MAELKRKRSQKNFTRKDFKYKRDFRKFEDNENIENEDTENERYSSSVFGFFMSIVLILFLWLFRFMLNSPVLGSTGGEGEDYPLLISITIILLCIPFFILGDEMSDSENKKVKFWGNVVQFAFGIGFLYGMGYMLFS
jgi:hypothetical protein